MSIEDRAHIEVPDAATLRAWLAAHHADADGVWVVTHKKGSGRPAPTCEALVASSTRARHRGRKVAAAPREDLPDST